MELYFCLFSANDSIRVERARDGRFILLWTLFLYSVLGSYCCVQHDYTRCVFSSNQGINTVRGYRCNKRWI